MPVSAVAAATNPTEPISIPPTSHRRFVLRSIFGRENLLQFGAARDGPDSISFGHIVAESAQLNAVQERIWVGLRPRPRSAAKGRTKGGRRGGRPTNVLTGRFT